MDGKTADWTDGLMLRQMDGWKDGQMEERMDGQMDGRMDRWTNSFT